MSLKNLKLVTVFLLCFATSSSFADIVDSEEATAFAEFILDLSNTTKATKSGSFCTIGNDEVVKVVGKYDKDFIDLNASESKSYEKCRIIYIAQSMEKGFRVDVARFNKAHIVTVAVFSNFVEGGGMIQVGMGRRNFELTLNFKTMKQFGVKLSPLNMGLVINN